MARSPKKVLVVGALGRMGVMVRRALADEPGLVVGAALERADHDELGSQIEDGIPVVSDPATALAVCDVAIDFSIPQSTLANLRVAADAGVPYVTGTTGFDDAGRKEIETLAARIPIIHAANFSLAVNVLAWLAREAAARLGPSFDAELFELHHSAKRDAPSGTALRLAEAVAAGRHQQLSEHVVLERAGDTGARPEAAIGIQTLRGGDNPGEHTVLFIGRGERLELVHRAATREHFACGAVRAAGWLIGKKPGLYAVERVFDLD
jgi:4-hydroxy-tetrahydrodipicolinate reductase